MVTVVKFVTGRRGLSQREQIAVRAAAESIPGAKVRAGPGFLIVKVKQDVSQQQLRRSLLEGGLAITVTAEQQAGATLTPGGLAQAVRERPPERVTPAISPEAESIPASFEVASFERPEVLTRRQPQASFERPGVLQLSPGEQQALRAGLAIRRQTPTPPEQRVSASLVERGVIQTEREGFFTPASIETSTQLELRSLPTGIREFAELGLSLEERKRLTDRKITTKPGLTRELQLGAGGFIFGAASVITSTPVTVFKLATKPVETLSQIPKGVEGVIKGIKSNPSETIGGLVGAAVIPGPPIGKLISKVPRVGVGISRVNIPTSEGLVTRRGFGIEVGSRSVGVVQRGERIPLKKITGEVAAPTTALQTKVLKESVELGTEGTTRIESIITSGRVLGTEKGLPVKKPVFELEQFKDPQKASKLVEDFLEEQKAVVFGSTTAQQLPKEFRLKPGDIDIVVPKKSKIQLEAPVKQLADNLKRIGEDIRVSRRAPTTLETSRGLKVLELKAGKVEPIKVPGAKGESLPEPAPVGGLGFRFGNLRAGIIGDVVPFGRGLAIRQGEQFLRKGVASAFISRFGVLPKSRRGLKDVAGFIASGRGLIEVRSRSFLGPLKAMGTKKAQRAIDDFVNTFNEQQKRAINNIIPEAGADIRIPLARFERPPSSSPSVFGPARGRPSPSIRDIGSPSPSPRPISPSIFRFPRSPSPSPLFTFKPIPITSISPSPIPPTFTFKPIPITSISPSPSPSPNIPTVGTPIIPIIIPSIQPPTQPPRKPLRKRFGKDEDKRKPRDEFGFRVKFGLRQFRIREAREVFAQ